MSELIRVVLVMIMSPTEMSELIRVVLVMIMSPTEMSELIRVLLGCGLRWGSNFEGHTSACQSCPLLIFSTLLAAMWCLVTSLV